jgi:predicted Holliday junction resolvase-like endonuclease
MTPLDIFIFVSFTILVLALKNFYEKYEAAQDLLEAFAHEIEERVSQNKSFQDKIVELNYTLDAKLQEYKSEKLLLEQQFVSQIKDLKNDVNNLIVDLEKKEIEHSIELTKATENARKDALKRSRSVIRGQASEHLAPFVIKDTNPKDYRFMGNPIDYICFDGLSDVLDGKADSINKIRFVDIKTGKSNLSKSQRRIRDAINSDSVEFKVINLDEVLNDNKVEQRIETQSSQESKN